MLGQGCRVTVPDKIYCKKWQSCYSTGWSPASAVTPLEVKQFIPGDCSLLDLVVETVNKCDSFAVI